MIPFNPSQTLTNVSAPIVTAPTTAPSSTPAPVNAVSPTFSIVQVADNARGNTTIVANTQGEEQNAPEKQLPSNNRPIINRAGGLGGTINFLAQLIGQEASSSSRTVLVQYEKLVNLSTVKYKPSDAFKPQAQPNDVFSKIVIQQRSEQKSITTKAASNNVAAQVSQQANTQNTTVQAATNSRAARAQPTIEEDMKAEEQAINAIISTQPVSANTAIRPIVLSAYISSASRVANQNLEDSSSNITDVA